MRISLKNEQIERVANPLLRPSTRTAHRFPAGGGLISPQSLVGVPVCGIGLGSAGVRGVKGPRRGGAAHANPICPFMCVLLGQWN